jgi:hypothetical protein
MKYLLAFVLVAVVLTGLAWLRVAPASPKPVQLEPSPPVPPAAARPLELPDRGAFPARPATSARAAAADLVDEISALLRPGTPLDRDRLVNDLLPRLVARDPSAATRLVAALAPGPLREELLRHLARLMSASDIHATLGWLAGLPPADRLPAAEAVIAQINQTDPAGAMGVANAFGIGLTDGRQEHLIQLWTEQEPAAAVAWVTAQPAGADRDRLLARTAFVRAQQEPAAAARLVLDQMSAGPAQEDALMSVVRQWAVSDPAAASDWVKQFPHGPLLTRAQAELELARKQR